MAQPFLATILGHQHSAAIKLLDGAISEARGSTPAQTAVLCSLLINRGVCNARLQLYRKALKDFDDAINQKPDCVEALYHKGVVLLALRKHKEAHDTWAIALGHATLHTDFNLIHAIHTALHNPHLQAANGISASGSVYQHHGAHHTAAHHAHTDTARTIHGAGSGSGSSAGGGAPGTPPPAAHPQPAPGSTLPQPGTPPSASNRATASSSPAEASSSAQCSTTSGRPRHAGDTHAHQPSSTCSSTSGAQQPHTAGHAHAHSPAKANHHPGAASASHADTGDTHPSSSSSNGSGTTDRKTSQAAKGHATSRAQGATAAAGHSHGSQHSGSQHSSSSLALPGPGGGSVTAVAPAAHVAAAIQTAVELINSGQVAAAEAMLNGVLENNPQDLGARVARGTARALQRELAGAVSDFTAAINIEPRYADTWKRRGQAQSAMGQTEAALADLQKAIELLALWGPLQDTSVSRCECHVEKGLIYQKQRDYRRAAAELRQAVKLDPKNQQAWNVLGLASTSQGELREGTRAYERAVELKPDLVDAWFNMAQARKEAGLVREAEAAFTRVIELEKGKSSTMHVACLKVMAQMRQQEGHHLDAISLLDRALPMAKDEQTVELRFLRAICHHALGQVQQAIDDYQACLTGALRPGELLNAGAVALTEEVRTLQYLAFYQRELALYLYHCLDRRADSFCPDSELNPLFKESWCKKAPPVGQIISSFTPQRSLPDPLAHSTPQPPSDTLQHLITLADQLGMQLQNQHQGFMSNVRQQRAAGLATLELAQAAREVVAARRQGQRVWVSNVGSSVHRGTEGKHEFGWRDAMDIIVKWRQLAEPNDQVLWVDLLTQREFEQGFGSHTPIFSGQTKCVRYYMNFARALELQKQVLLKEGHAFDAQNRHVPCGGQHQQDAIRSARTAEDMYGVLKTDSWVVVPISSVARSGHMMEGTRLTLTRVPSQPDAYEFSIRTPVTPPRWRDFDVEMEAAWEALMSGLAQDPVDLRSMSSAIMTYTYYWYNFMPLARGTAACGYTTMLALFWAAGMPITARIPKDTQVDWEAILSQHPQQFIDSVGKWMLPAAARNSQPSSSPAASPALVLPDVSELPLVKDVVATLRQRLEVLNPAGQVQLPV